MAWKVEDIIIGKHILSLGFSSQNDAHLAHWRFNSRDWLGRTADIEKTERILAELSDEERAAIVTAQMAGMN